MLAGSRPLRRLRAQALADNEVSDQRTEAALNKASPDACHQFFLDVLHHGRESATLLLEERVRHRMAGWKIVIVFAVLMIVLATPQKFIFGDDVPWIVR